MEKTLSQKIARTFEIAGYILLLPSALSLLFPLMGIFGALASLSFLGAVLCVIPFLIFGFGLMLLKGYYRHSRGLLADDKIQRLWIHTFFFNLLLFLPNAFSFYNAVYQTNPYDRGFEYNVLTVAWILLAGWLEAAVILPLAAIYTEIRKS